MSLESPFAQDLKVWNRGGREAFLQAGVFRSQPVKPVAMPSDAS